MKTIHISDQSNLDPTRGIDVAIHMCAAANGSSSRIDLGITQKPNWDLEIYSLVPCGYNKATIGYIAVMFLIIKLDDDSIAYAYPGYNSRWFNIVIKDMEAFIKYLLS